MEKILIVGDRFKSFSIHENVMTFSQFRSAMLSGDQFKTARILIGQGVGSYEYATIKSMVHSHAALSLHSQIELEDTDSRDCLIDYKHQLSVHKSNPKNILIQKPEKISDSLYHSKLILQNDNELLLDHMTGQHIQGIILTEAARQMMLSVTENFYLDSPGMGKYYFILNSVESNYKNFVFPAAVDITFDVTVTSRSKNGAISAVSKACFHQNNIDVSDVTINYSAYKKNLIDNKENRMAKSLADNILMNNKVSNQEYIA